MTRFTEEDKKIISKAKKLSRLELSTGTYIINGSGYKEATGELLGQKVADLIGLKHINYHVVLIDNQAVTLSEFQENFKTAKESFLLDYYLQNSEISIDPISLYDIWIAIERKYEEVEALMKDVIKMYLMDTLLLNIDRNDGNWGIIEENGKKSICIMDNEFALRLYEQEYFAIREDLEPEEDDSIKDLERFLSESSEEFRELAENIFKTLNPETIKTMIESIQKEVDRENRYKEHYDMLKKHFDDNYERLSVVLFKEPEKRM